VWSNLSRTFISSRDRTIRGASIVFLLLTCNVPGSSRNLPLPDHPRYAIEHFGERFGLGAATVVSLAQDPQGFLWIGTQSGLFRYDGASAKHFGTSEGLPSEIVRLIVLAPDGGVWVRTRKGIARLDYDRFTALTLPAEAGDLADRFQSFTVDNTGTLFIATEHGLLRMEPGKSTLRFYRKADGLPTDRVDSIVRGPDNTVWFAAGDRIGRFAPGSAQPAFLSVRVPDDQVRTLLLDAHGIMWVRSTHHLGSLDPNQAAPKFAWIDDGLPGPNWTAGPSLDAQGNPMLPTVQGLYRHIGNQWRVIDHHSGLTSSATVCALQDREGGIWVGMAGAGLDHWPGSQQWSGWTDAEGLPDALVLGVARDQHSRLWVDTNTALTVWDPATRGWQTWTDNGLAGTGAAQLVESSDGAVWALFGKGLFRFDAASLRPTAVRASPDCRRARRLHLGRW
jgi:ligand-binding sensor domain-containing protein